MRALGATIVDPANIPTAKEMSASEAELTVLLYEFKADLNAYLAALPASAPVRSLADLIAFNEAHASEEMPYFGQEILLLAQEKGPLTEQAYLDALAENYRLSRAEGIDAMLERNNWTRWSCRPAARLEDRPDHRRSPYRRQFTTSGVGGLSGNQRPAGICRWPAGRPHVHGAGVFCEARLIQLAYAFEQATHARRAPRYTRQTP